MEVPPEVAAAGDRNSVLVGSISPEDVACRANMFPWLRRPSYREVRSQLKKLKEQLPIDPPTTSAGESDCVKNTGLSEFLSLFGGTKIPVDITEKPKQLVIHDLAEDTSEDELRKLLETFGTLRMFRFPKIKGSGKCRGVCVVEFKSIDDANRAKEQLSEGGYEIEWHVY